MASVKNIQSKFIVRVSNLPVVSCAIDAAANTYGRLKVSNRLLNYTLSTAEKYVLYANELSKPFVKRFESQILTADLLACKGLNTLEDMKAFGAVKANAVKQYGLKTANVLVNSRCVNFSKCCLSTVITVTERSLDRYLPAIEEEEEEVAENGKTPTIFARIGNISRRVYGHAVWKVSNLKYAAINLAVQKIFDLKYAAIDLFLRCRTLVLLELTNLGLSFSVVNVSWLWEKLHEEPDHSEPATLTEKAITTARYTSRTALTVLVAVRTSVQGTSNWVNSGFGHVYSLSIVKYRKIFPLGFGGFRATYKLVF